MDTTSRTSWITHSGLPYAAKSHAFWAGTQWESERAETEAVIHVAAECHYRLWINDSFVGAGPARGSRRVNFADCHPIGQLLQIGTNSIMVAIQAPGWRTFRASPSLASLWVSIPGQVSTDATWKTRLISGWRSDAPTFTFQHGPMEWVDLADGPDRPPTDTAGWLPAAVITKDEASDHPAMAELLSKELLPRDIPSLIETGIDPVGFPLMAAVSPGGGDSDDVAAIMQNEAHTAVAEPVALERLLGARPTPVDLAPDQVGEDVALIIDFGKEVNGTFQLDLDAPAGTVIDIGYGEHLVDGRVRTVVHGYRFADRQITRSGRQRVGTWFDERGFRFVQVVFRHLSEPLTIHQISASDRRYPFQPTGSFSSDDAQLDAIWDICTETISACATDTFVDCPWRENTLYINDLLVENVAALVAFGDPRLTARSLRLALSEADQDGLVPASVPNGLQPGMDQQTADAYMTFPATQLYLTEIVEDLLLYSGDLETATVLTEHLVGTLEQMEQWQDPYGLMRPPEKHWNFVDWAIDNEQAHALRGQASASVNWFWVRALDSMVRLSGWTGVGADRVDRWRQRAAEVTAAIRDHLWNPNLQHFNENARDNVPAGTQISQALAILSGRLDPDSWPRLDGPGISPSELYMLHFVLQADVSSSGTGAALERIRNHWGPMIDAESPTVWECGVSQSGAAAFAGAGSLCHGFATTPVVLLQRHVLGVIPTAPGFAQFSIAPDLGGLTRASGDIPTPHGPISVQWQRTDQRIHGEIQLPTGVIGTLSDGTILKPGHHPLTISTR